MLHMGLPGRSMSSQTKAARDKEEEIVCVRLGSWSSRHGTNEGYGTCEELDLFGRAALVECVGPALRLRLHHGVIVVPAKAHQVKQAQRESLRV